ncbi:hypothetical protein BDV10DRAFT_189087 [Aspergillus recurvatus]
MSDFSFSTTGSDVVQRWGKYLAGKKGASTPGDTGASTGGLGGATATALATANPAPAHIILLARSLPKVHGIINKISETSPQTKCSFIPIELDEFDSVRKAADCIKELVQHGKIDLLINNAGVMAIPWGKNKNGIEKTLAINHLGHFLLTGLLMPLILKGDGGRVVNLSSAGYEMGPFRREDWNFEDGKTYHPLSTYAQSKTANILFTIGLAQRYKRNGLLAFAVHPGFIPDTSLTTHVKSGLDVEEMDRIARENTGYPFGPDPPKPLKQGIATTLVAALSPELEKHNGAYLADCQVADVRHYAKDPEIVEFLWGLSEKLLGELDS